VAELGAQNADLLHKRDQLQAQIDDWHKANPAPIQPDRYKAFLQAAEQSSRVGAQRWQGDATDYLH